MTSSNTFKTLKQNLAGLAIATIALTGLTAISPAHATVYASNAGSVADPNRSFTYHNTGTALDGSSQTTVTVPANSALSFFALTTTLTSSQSIALQGQVITYEYSVKNTATNALIQGGGTNPGARVNNNYSQFSHGQTPTLTWPSTTGTADELNMSVNYEYGSSYTGGAIVPAGTYLITVKFFGNGTLIAGTASAPTLTFAALGATSGTVPTGSTLEYIKPGYVCVNPSLVTAGDVLTARPILDGTALSNTQSNAYWYQGGGNSGANTMMTNTRTVLAGDISNGLAYKNLYIGGNITAGTPFVFDLSIQKANGTEVTYPCPSLSVATPVITSSSSTQVVFTVAGASPSTFCRVMQSVNMNGTIIEMPAGFGTLVGSTCTVNPNMGTFNAGTYTVQATVSGFWNDAVSANNPTFTIAGSNPSNGPSSGGTVTANPATPSFSNGVITSTAGTWQNASVNLRGYWNICTLSHPSATGNINSPRPSDCGPISATALSGQSATWISTNPYTIPATVNKWVVCVSNGCTTTPVSTVGAFFAWYESDSGNWAMSATIGADGSSTSATPTPESALPLPTWATPILTQIPALGKSLSTIGGKLGLTSGDFSGLKSVTVGGTAVAFTIDGKGDVSIPVPAGKVGSTADLVVTFTGGKMIIQEGIKYVASVTVANVPVRPISIAAGSTKLSETVADQIRQAAYSNPKNTSIACVAYSANNSAAAKAAAMATAAKVCALAVKANPALQASPVSVIVNKIKAKTEAVGIKVFKPTN